MKLGLFVMALHDPQRDYTQLFQEGREAILLAALLLSDHRRPHPMWRIQQRR